jgi:uncharacterized protein (AIM24 family)
MASTARGRDPAVEEEFLGALYKGGELLAAGKLAEARAYLERAHELQPKNEKAQNLLGLTYFKLGAFDDAARIYEVLVRENPVDPTLRINLGLVYLKKNNLERSIKEFETATDLEPNHQKAHNYLGLALAQAGEYAKAREHFHAAGSEAMAEKMTKALVARAEAAANDGPGLVVTTGPARAQAVTNAPARPIVEPSVANPPAPPVSNTDTGGTWDVMSDEEVPSDAFTVPEGVAEVRPDETKAAPAPRLDSDWGAQIEPPAASQPAPAPVAPPSARVTEAPEEEELRFAEDEGPSAATLSLPTMPTVSSESMPVLDASAVEVEATHVESTVASAMDAGPPTHQVPPPPTWTTGAPAWLTMEAAEAANAAGETQWVTEGLTDVPLPPEHPAAMEAEVSWGATQEDPRWATASAAAAGAWTTAVSPGSAPGPEARFTATVQADAGPIGPVRSAEGASWAPGTHDAVGGPVPPIEVPEAPSTSDAFPAPAPSGPDLPIDVAPPVTSEGPEWVAPPASFAEAAAGSTALPSQRLVDLGAASGWVQEPTGGPFHLSREGLAVKVAGEVLSRMIGLVAVVGGLEVKPEVRRRRGRPTQEPFGVGPLQLHRLSGNGLVYLEPGKHRFFAVDLTDTGGASVDDDGAYLREEVVFAFEEPVSYENGRITGEGLVLDLVHLKGTGKALLQLEGTMKAMPIPPGAPMVVPLKRLVGWFGRVTPRLMSFGGQGAVELTGDGYALLETPGERG